MNEILVQKGYKKYKIPNERIPYEYLRRNPEVMCQLESKSLLLKRIPGWKRRENPYLD
jgi:hypothetical protein